MFLRSPTIPSFLFRSENFIYGWRTEVQAHDELYLFNPSPRSNVSSIPNTHHLFINTLWQSQLQPNQQPLPIDKMQALRKSCSIYSSLKIARRQQQQHHHHHHSSPSTCSTSETDSLLLIRELASLTKLGHDTIFELTVNALRTVLTVGEEPNKAKKKMHSRGRRNHPNSQSPINKSHAFRFCKLNRTSFTMTPTTTPTTSPSTIPQHIVRFNPVVKIFYI